MGDNEPTTPMSDIGVPIERPLRIETPSGREARQQVREQNDIPLSMGGEGYNRDMGQAIDFAVSSDRWAKASWSGPNATDNIDSKQTSK